MKHLLVAIALVALPVLVHAQTPAPTPQALFRQGEGEYAAGRYEAAIALWERAYTMDPRAGLQYNLAQAYGRTGMIVEERHALELFLERLAISEPLAMNGPDASSARARIAAIDERLARTAIVLRGVPRHAAISLDGALVTLDGDRLPVTAGSHSLRVELPGFLPFTTTITVLPAAIAEVHVELHVATPAQGADDGDEDDGSAAEPAAPRGPSRLGEALLISGGGVVLVGSALGGVAIHNSRGALRGSAEGDRGHSFGIAADVTLSVGAALAVAGLVIVLVRDDAEGDEAPSPTVALGVTRSASGTNLPSLEVIW